MKLKNLVINVSIIIVIVAIFIVGYIIFKKYYGNYKNEQDISKFITEVYDNSTLNSTNNNLEYKGYKVLGIVKISKIDLMYPIIDPLNRKNDALNVSIIKFAGGNLNDFGNVTLAGHNYYDTTMFAKLHLLRKSDKIEIIDNTKTSFIYEVYDIYNVSPDDTSPCDSNDKNSRELTLITCTKGNSERLVIKAKEIK